MLECPRCGRGSLVEITMRVADLDVAFRRCSRCDRQTWSAAGDPIPLERVLTLARTHA